MYVCIYKYIHIYVHIYREAQIRELLKTPTKIEEIPQKKLLTEIEPLLPAF